MPSQAVNDSLQRMFKNVKESDAFAFPTPIAGPVVSRKAIEQLLRLFKQNETRMFQHGTRRAMSKSIERRESASSLGRREFLSDRRSLFSDENRGRLKRLLEGKSITPATKVSNRGKRGGKNRRSEDDRRISQAPLAVGNLGFTEKTITADLERFLRKMDIQDSGLSGLK